MRHVIIWNPTAGKENAAKNLLPSLQAAFDKQAIPVEMLQTGHPGHARELAQDLAKSRAPIRFYACGGDGTLNEVLHGAYPYPNAQVACVPCGSGNDFLRNFGTQEEFLQLDDLIAGTAVPIDLIQVNEDQIAASICSAGLDAKVAYGIPKFRRIPLCGGSAAYNLSIVQCLLKPLGSVLSLTIDGKEHLHGNYLLACIGNGRYYGGGYCGAPTAQLDDGLLELILIRKVSRFKIASLLSCYKRGEHFQGGKIAPQLEQYFQHAQFHHLTIQSAHPFIYNVDGECAPTTHLELQILPKAAEFVLPSKVYLRYQTQKAASAKTQLV